MPGHQRKPLTALPAVALLVATLPLLVGQGCPPPGRVLPVTAQPATVDAVPPSFQFTAPAADQFAEVGEVVRLAWSISDPAGNALITLLVDPDQTFGNQNETVIAPVILSRDGITSFELDTSSLAPATYRIIARVSDGVNPDLLVVAPGRLVLLGRGFLPGNRSPIITMTEPDISIGVFHNDVATIGYCGHDPDGGPEGRVADVILLLDHDTNPNNDLDLRGPPGAARSRLDQVCLNGFFPQRIDGAIVLGCFSDDNCTDPAAATEFDLEIDVTQIPPRPDGSPYHVRATMWDGANPPVHAYARGTISVTALASGLVDLGQVGRTISGTKFFGNDAGQLAGFTGLGVGDIDGDGVDDFVLVSRLGRPFGVNANAGTAHLILGLPGGQKFGGEVPLNSISSIYRGTIFTMPRVIDTFFNTEGITEGITSIARVEDVTGDGLPEFMLGMPYIESFYDHADDDPCRADNLCYFDRLPNPQSRGDGCRGLDMNHLRRFDWREGAINVDEDDPIAVGLLPDCRVVGDDVPCLCSNDGNLAVQTPISGGYSLMVSSENSLESNIIFLGEVGQFNESPPFGARWRGAWYSLFRTASGLAEDDFEDEVDEPFDPLEQFPFLLDPLNRWGQTIASTPPVEDSRTNIPDGYGTALLKSAPSALEGFGLVTYWPTQDWTNAAPEGQGECRAQSFPYYEPRAVGDRCGRGLRTPVLVSIPGARRGDRLGYAAPAGDFNLDGARDILMGAPGANRGGLVNNGIVYILYGRPDFWRFVGDLRETFLTISLANDNPPRMEIRGTRSGDRFGAMQTVIGDVNLDGISDIAFASPFARGRNGEPEAGFIGIVFGGRRATGEDFFTVDDVGTPILPGVRIYGTVPGGHAGVQIANAGDFNGDGHDDLLILAPNETRSVLGQPRRGVAYLIFGGQHLANGPWTLDQVGTAALPGMVFVSPYPANTADEATIDFVAPAGDINGDGFDDILLGVSQADWVNPLEPSQRRRNVGEAYLIYGSNIGPNTAAQ